MLGGQIPASPAAAGAQPWLWVGAGPCSASARAHPAPPPQKAGGLQGSGAAVPALLGKDQADTSEGEQLPVLSRGSLGQDATPCAGPGQGTGQPLSPAGSWARCCGQHRTLSSAWGASCH